MEVILSGGKVGSYKLRIKKIGYGNFQGNPTTTLDFKYEFKISSISPNIGSKKGGTTLLITGINFSPKKS